MSENIILADGRKLGSLKVVDLKKELEALGLDKNGLKKDQFNVLPMYVLS